MGNYISLFPLNGSDIAGLLATVAAIVAVIVTLYVHFDAKRPYVVAYVSLDKPGGSFFVIVENFGKAVARNVSIDGFDPDAMCEEGFRKNIRKSFLFRGVPTLVPGSNRRTMVASAKHVSENLVDVVVEVEVSYEWRRIFRFRNRKESEKFVLDFYSFAGTILPAGTEYDPQKK